MLASSCAAGAYSATQDEQITEKMRQFGEFAGIAFQLKDDLFDYGVEDVGKPTGNDIREKKLTLPLIFTLQQASREIKRKLTYIIKNKNKDKKSIEEVIREVKQAGGIKYAEDVMEQYKTKALNILTEFPLSPEREALSELVKYTTERKK